MTSVPTRKLCAGVYVDRQLRKDVHDHYTKRDHQAWAPCYSVDLVAVLRHTRRADRMDVVLDWVLVAWWLMLIAALGRLLFERWLIGCLVVTPLVVLLWVLRAVLVRAGVRRRVVMIGMLAPVVVALITPAGRTALAAVILALVVGWLGIAAVGAVAFVRASKLTRPGQEPPRHLVRPIADQVEKRAEELSDCNVLIYSRERATDPLGPFVGTGQRLLQWSTPLVNLRNRKDDDGNAPAVATLDVAALHRHLKRATEGQGVPGLRSQHRLYVDGVSVSRSPALLEHPPYGPPRAVVPVDAVLERVAVPLNYQRGYLCLQVADQQWTGDVVITMLVRAVREGDLLHLELRVNALPPVELLLAIPGRLVSAAWSGVKAGTYGFGSTLFGAVPRRALAFLSPVFKIVTNRLYRHQINRGVWVDFGADTSLREHLADGQTMHFNVLTDTMGQLHRLQHHLLNAFSDYLVACGIDPGDLVKESRTIINNIQQNIINNSNAGAITFGANSPASGTVTPPAPAPSPSAGGAGPA